MTSKELKNNLGFLDRKKLLCFKCRIRPSTCKWDLGINSEPCIAYVRAGVCNDHFSKFSDNFEKILKIFDRVATYTDTVPDGETLVVYRK